jgi:hypothetical protein
MRCAALLCAFACVFPVAVSSAADQLVIRQAVYGDLPEGGKTDVTKIVSAFVRDGQLRIEAANNLFGDPAEQVGKTLKVAYELNGEAGEVSVREGETLLLPTPVLKGELTILSAEYGDLPDGPSEDVLGTVKLYVKNNRLEIDVENYLLGDPASGVFKRLRVEYTIGDVKLAKSAYEGNTLVIEVPAEDSAQGSKPEEQAGGAGAAE